MITKCPDDTTLSKCLAGDLTEAQIESLFKHIDQCERCKARVPEIERSGIDETIEFSDLIQASRLDPAVPKSCQRLIDDSACLIGETQPSIGDYELGEIKIIRDYEILGKIGSGGMGDVFLARHRHLKRQVALKILLPQRFGSQAAIRQFRTEMEAVGNLNHPNIVRALDAGEHDGIHYLVMEYEEGQTLKQIVDSSGPLSFPNGCDVIRQTASGLSFAHSQGLVHRDIKPSNLIITPNGRLRILDFGLALLDSERPKGQSNVIAGSFGFMAPEQFQSSESVNDKADIFSLGATFFYAVTSQHVIQKKASFEMSRFELSSDFASELDARKLPRKVRQLIEAMVDLKPMNRPSTDEVVKLLYEYQAKSNLMELVPNPSNASDEESLNRFSPNTKSVSHWKNGSSIVAAVCLVLAIFAIVTISRNNNSPSTSKRESNAPSIVFADPSRTVAIAITGNSQTDNFRVFFAPGRELVVTQGEGETIQAWDVLDLKLKSESAFVGYEMVMDAASDFVELAEQSFQNDHPLPKSLAEVFIVGETKENGIVIDLYQHSYRARWSERITGRIDLRIQQQEKQFEASFGNVQLIPNASPPFLTVYQNLENLRMHVKDVMSK